MSQTYAFPITSGATLSASRATINDAIDALLTSFIGAALPSGGYVTDGILAIKNVGAGVYELYARVGSAWVLICPHLENPGGGLLHADGGILESDLDANGFTVLNLVAPSADTHAATKLYADTVIRHITLPLDSISASKNEYLLRTVGTKTIITAAYFVPDTTIAEHGSNYWDLTIKNLTDTQDLLSTHRTTNSGAASNHGAFTANTPVELGFASGFGQNNYNNLASGKLLQLEITKNGSATTVARGSLILHFSCSQ